MIRLLALPVLCASLHTIGLGPLGLERYVPVTTQQLQTLGWYLKWVVTWLTAREANAVLNRWAENRWIWNNKPTVSDWSQEIAIVTGGANGIGACVVKKLVERGIKVAILDIGTLSDTITPRKLSTVRRRHYCGVRLTPCRRAQVRTILQVRYNLQECDQQCRTGNTVRSRISIRSDQQCRHWQRIHNS